MNKNLTIVMIISIILVAGAFIFLQQDVKELEGQIVDECKTGLVTDAAGLGDQAVNDAVWRGLKRAEQEFGCKITAVESGSINDYIPNLRSLAEKDYDLIWAVGLSMTDSLIKVADSYPETIFAVINAEVDKENVISITFKEQVDLSQDHLTAEELLIDIVKSIDDAVYNVVNSFYNDELKTGHLIYRLVEEDKVIYRKKDEKNLGF